MTPMPLPRAVQTAIFRLEKNGFEACVVGGGVGDHLMGIAPHDFDLTTNARPDRIKACFHGFPVIETGIAHGTVTVLIDKMPLEITTFRTDGDYADHRHPDAVAFTDDLTQDLARRDFTVNAMAYSPSRGIVDPFGGQNDLSRGVIRCVGEAEKRFDEDALRILRALRFSAVLGFSIDEDTAAAAHDLRATLAAVSAERIYAEFCKLVCGKNAFGVLGAFPDVIGVFIPEILPCVGFNQRNRNHSHDVYLHMLYVLKECPPVLPLRLAAYLHDIAKPQTASFDEERGIMRFTRHPAVGADTADAVLRRLRADNATRDLACRLIRHHDDRVPPERPAVRRLMQRFSKEELPLFFAIQRADALDHNVDFRTERLRRLEEVERIVAQLEREDTCLNVRDLCVNGNDLISLGYRGRAVGQALQTLLDAVIDERVRNSREDLLSFLAQNKPEL